MRKRDKGLIPSQRRRGTRCCCLQCCTIIPSAHAVAPSTTIPSFSPLRPSLPMGVTSDKQPNCSRPSPTALYFHKPCCSYKLTGLTGHTSWE
jgi:hypothetical protein